MSEMTREQALAHFGVKGMKWGSRKTPGVATRATRALATGKTNYRIGQHKKALAGKGVVGLAAKLDKHTWGGKGRFEGYHNKKISELERSNERIAAGDLAIQTILLGPRYSKAPKK